MYKEDKMTKKFSVLILMLLVLTAAAIAAPDVDTITAASGMPYYKNSSYNLEQLKASLAAYPYKAAISVATVNADGSPNAAVVIPGLTADGRYLTFGLAGNRTRDNFIERELAVVMFYEYTPSADKANRNKGCKVVVKYVGNPENERLNRAAGNEKPSLFMEIIEILPIG